MFIARNILVEIKDNRDLKEHIARKFRLNSEQIKSFEIIRRSIDARKRGRLKYNYTVWCEIFGDFQSHPELVRYSPKPAPKLFRKKISNNPIIIGAGPAGLFAALSLVEQGFSPVIFERGKEIADRNKDVMNFWERSILNPESNVQFGEGGAGTFSDGKLTSRGKDFFTSNVFDLLVKFGANPDIKVNALPHLGTDGLKIIVNNIKKYLIENGCEFHFNSRFEDIESDNGKVKRIKIDGSWFEFETIILAIGNAARDTYRMLSKHMQMESKSLAIGFRIEHPIDFINQAFYGKNTDFNISGAATYRLTAKYKERGIYSFCMCPGGKVIAASSDVEQVVTNGMSYSLRDNSFSNSAIVATLNKNDYGKGIFAAMDFQESLEKKCFNSDFPYHAPSQNAEDYLNNIVSKKVRTNSYRPATYKANLNDFFPKTISSALKAGLYKFQKSAPGFINNGVLIAPETRTSAPIRILRDRENFNSIGLDNFYPIGEGSGYAGGIISSAVDGYKVGKIFEK